MPGRVGSAPEKTSLEKKRPTFTTPYKSRLHPLKGNDYRPKKQSLYNF